MKKRRLLSTLSYVVGMVLLAATVVQAQIPLDTQGGVTVWHEDLPSPGPGLAAYKVILQGPDGSSLVTFENIALSGAVVQQWLPGSFGGPPQPTTWVGQAPAWDVIPQQWKDADSHILVEESQVGGGAGGSFTGLGEVNDQSDPESISEALPTLPNGGPPAVSGMGGIQMAASTDAFFLDTAFQGPRLELAHVVTTVDESGALGEVLLTIGVLGEGITNSGDPGGASWGFNDVAALNVSVPEPATGALALASLLGLFALRRRS